MKLQNDIYCRIDLKYNYLGQNIKQIKSTNSFIKKLLIGTLKLIEPR